MKSRVRASAIVLHNDRLLTFRAIDPGSQREYLFLPGGEIEPEETAPEAAERETLEETGFQISVDPATATDREYFFYWNGTDYDCLTLFYLGKILTPLQKPVEDADYNKEVVWIPLNQIPTAFSYSEEIRSAIIEIVQKAKDQAAPRD